MKCKYKPCNNHSEQGYLCSAHYMLPYGALIWGIMIHDEVSYYEAVEIYKSNQEHTPEQVALAKELLSAGWIDVNEYRWGCNIQMLRES